MKILVTGAAGFIGGQLWHTLWKRGDEVVGIDNFSYGNPDNLKFDDHDFGAEVRRMDIRDKAGIDALCFGSDFDGIGGCTLEFRDYAGFPRILNAIERHFSDGEIEKICRGNALRILRDVVG